MIDAPSRYPATEVHPVFRKFRPFSGQVPAGLRADWNGMLIDDRLFDPAAQVSAEPTYIAYRDHPTFEIGCGLFDLIGLYRSVLAAEGRFVMAELGAGYGYWLSQGAAAARQRGLDFSLIGVEAEPSHFQMMLRHLRYNGIDPDRHTIIEAAIAPSDGVVSFAVGGDPASNWGQSIVAAEHPEANPVRAISLATLLRDHQVIDLIQMDAQGVEYDVLHGAYELVTDRVKTLIIGTHSAEIERNLLNLFEINYWSRLYYFPLLQTNQTPYGPAEFGDGVLIMENRRFC